MSGDDPGSTIPLILGFFVIALLAVTGSIALGDAFVQQRDLQDACDGAAAAAAATAVDLRGDTNADDLPLGDVDTALRDYLDRDPDRAQLHIRATLSPDRTRVTMHCTQQRDLAFGATFGSPTIIHTATSTASTHARD